MSELRADEAGLAGVRRILQSWIAEASGSLHRQRVIDANIHDARKQLKRARAALHLLRDAIGDIAYRRENAALRDAARPLSVARDSKVSIAALDDLIERHGPTTRALRLGKFRRVLRKERAASRQAMTAALANRQLKILREVSARSERWRLRGEDWHIIGAGLERIYRRGRKGMSSSARSRASEDLHDWRKQVKYLWHQLQILEPMRPGMLGKLAAQAHKLADYLGDDHDLAALRQKITAHTDAFEDADRDALLAALDRRRKQLQNRAFKLGARVFEEKPRRFIDRLGNYWHQWRVD